LLRSENLFVAAFGNRRARPALGLLSSALRSANVWRCAIAGGAHPDRLTPREGGVLKLVAAGLTNREIAARLGCSPRTVDAHVRSVYAKLGVGSRSAATRYALQRGLV
jgi:DNA-binding NarL/FixJ family response regulator